MKTISKNMSISIIVASVLFIFSSCTGTKQAVVSPSKKITKTETTPISETIETKESEKIISKKVKDTIVETKIVSKDTIAATTQNIVFIEAFNHEAWNTLLQKHVTNNGNVNYKGFKADNVLFKKYLQSLSDTIPNDTWTTEGKLAYWINAYNAFTIKLIIDKYPVKSIKDIENPWDYRFFKLGKKWFTLNDIEHKILRKINDPRIHFGIVCASVSCPKLQNEAFTASNVNEKLDNATKEFLADPNRNNLSQNAIKISKIFKWFTKDFKTEGSLIDFLNKYSEITISQNAKKSYKEYNWNLNE